MFIRLIKSEEFRFDKFESVSIEGNIVSKSFHIKITHN